MELLSKLNIANISKFYITDFIQILIIFFILYYIVKNIKNTRAWVLVKGLMIVLFVYIIMSLFSLTTVQYLIEHSLQFIAFAIIIMFQPELQKLIETIGSRDVRTVVQKLRKSNTEYRYLSPKSIDEICIACDSMSKAKTGVLIVGEREIPLTNIIETGIELNADITSQLLINIFEKNTPLHDGALIVQDNKLKSATCYLPLTKDGGVDKSLGTRHRAGLGVSENTDAFVIIVSEETGSISLCENGKINHAISVNQLKERLTEICKANSDKKVQHKGKFFRTTNFLTQLVVALASFCIWSFIVINNDADITTTFTDIPVQIKNDDVMETIGQTYQVISGDTVDVVVKGRRSVVSALKEKDIVAVADFTKMSQVNAVPIDVELLTVKDSNITVETTADDVMILALDDILDKDVPITVEKIGVNAPDYFSIVNELDFDTIKVTAPESKIKTIAYAKLYVDVTNKNSDFITNCEPILYDKDGNEINTNGITVDKEIMISCTTLRTKTIPISVSLADTLETNNRIYELINYELEKDEITISAESEFLDELDTLNVVINPETLSSDASALMLTIPNYLDENVYLVNEDDAQIKLSLDINVYELHEFNILKDNIKVENKNENLNVVLNSYPQTLKYYILTTFEDISFDLLNPTIVCEKKVGDYTTTLQLTNIDGWLLVDDTDLTVTYTVTKLKGK